MIPPEAEQLRLLKLHKRWADGYALFWQVIVIGSFIGVYALLDYAKAPPENRTLALILLMSVLLAAAIWQAVGLGLYRIHLLVKGFDLEPRPRAGKIS